MILAIVGPTGVGKTKLSIELAKIYNGEIINCDSTQVYKGLDVGTAKITKKEMEHIKHHLLNIKEVDESYTVFDYQKDARECIEKIKNQKKVPIFVGGTGMYLKAALYDYEFSFESDSDELYENLTNEQLIQKIDAYETGIVYDKKNQRRMVRLLAKLENDEIIPSNGFHLLYPDVLFIGLKTDRETLYQRINERFDSMLVPLIDEVKPFIMKKIKTKPFMSAIGYKEFYDFFLNKKTLQQVVEECKQNSRNYAKRQFTWFTNQMDVKWFDVNYDDFHKTIEEIVEYIEVNKKL